MNIKKLKGVVVASTTPFNSSREIDEAAAGRLMRYYIDNELDGVFLLSSTGEYFSIMQSKREWFVDICIRELDGKVPVFVMVSDACMDNVLENIRKYGRKKVDALVLTAPYYIKYSQDELYEFFCIAADNSPVPIMIYNVPARIPSNIELELVQALSRHENIIGIKDTHMDADRLFKLINMFRDRDDFLVYAGSERFAGYAALLGGNFVYALAAADPALFKEILKCGAAKDIDSVMKLQTRINKLFGLLNAVRGGYGESFSNFTMGIKAALKLKGICDTCNSQLGYQVTEQELERVENIMKNL